MGCDFIHVYKNKSPAQAAAAAGRGGAWPRQRRDQAHRSRATRGPFTVPKRLNSCRHRGEARDDCTAHVASPETRTQAVWGRQAALSDIQTRWKYEKAGNSRNERRCRCPATGWLVHEEGRRGSRGCALPLYRPHPPFFLAAPNV